MLKRFIGMAFDILNHNRCLIPWETDIIERILLESIEGISLNTEILETVSLGFAS